MKVLLINHFPLTGSGSGVYTANIANSLVRLGHEVCVIFPENEEIEKNDSIKMHPVYFNTNELPFNFPCFTTHPRSNKTFYELTDEEFNNYKNAFKNAIENEIEEFEPYIIHSGHIWTLSSIAGNYGIPLVVVAHGTDLIGYEKDKRFRSDAIDCFNKANKIITISKDNEELVNKTFGPGKTELIPNGFDPFVFYKDDVNKKEILNNLGITNNYENIVSFAGKFTNEKGIDTLLKAAKIYEDENTATILAGNGDLFLSMNNLAKELNLKHTYFVKNQTHNILRGIYNIADVSIIPSRKEAFGLVVIEAMACGTPVIGSNTGGIKDIINEDVGFLNEVDDEYNLAGKVKYILNNKDSFNRDYIAKYTKDTYSQDAFTEELIETYINCINYQKPKK